MGHITIPRIVLRHNHLSTEGRMLINVPHKYPGITFDNMELSLADRDRHVIWHPFTPQKNSPDIIPIVRGEGVYLIDDKGNRYIDAISSWWVNLHGHAHPYIAEKIYEQAKKLEHVIFAGFTHEPALGLAEKLLSVLTGNFAKIFYSDDGSTSTEVAIKMALQYWWNEEESGVGSQESGVRSQKSGVRRNKILALNNSYHGDTFGAMSVSDRGIFTMPFYDKLFEVIFINPPDESSHGVPRTSFNLQLSTFNLNEIACFIYEPLVQGAGGMKMYDARGLNELLKICKEHNIICIADEVMTGFYRTGRLFASAYCEEQPDIICLSKGLTGGTMALGVTACTERIYNAFLSEDKLKTFFHGHSFTANPLACSAALASLELLQLEECRIQIEMVVEEHNQFCQQLIADHSLTNKVKNIRQLGTIIAFEVVTEGKDEYLNNISSIITQKALRQGVYLRPLGNTIYIMPPYCITKKDLKTIYATILDILLSIYKQMVM